MTVADAWLLPDDGIVDPVALKVAMNGTRPIEMTARERVLAALLIQAQHRHCLCHDGEPSSLLETIRENLSLPSIEAAAALVASLPTGAKASYLVRYWTSPKFREDETRRRAASRKARQAQAA